MFDECYVESWTRKIDEKGKEFISFRIISKSDENGEIRVERRYSEFHKLHTEVLTRIKDKRLKSLLTESFPPKSFLSLQTDLFAEKRSRALDAYLQILTHWLRERERDMIGDVAVREFFGIASSAGIVRGDAKGERRQGGPAIKTPNTLNSEIEALRLSLDTSDPPTTTMTSLQEKILRLQERGEPEDMRWVEKFYEVKREWEVRRIRRGEYEGNEFWIGSGEGGSKDGGIKDKPEADKKDEREGDKKDKPEGDKKDKPELVSKHLETCPSTLDSLDTTKHYLRDQDAILSDLASTLQQQKQVSLAICEEIAQQNRVIGEFGRKQEGTIGEFLGSTERARKLQ